MVAEKRQRRALLGACARRWYFSFGSRPHYSGGRLFQHREFILFNYLLFGELHCAVAVNGLHDVDA